MPAAVERRRRRKSDVISATWMVVISLMALGSILLSNSKAGSADVNAASAEAKAARAEARAIRAEIKAARAQDEAVRQREGRRVALDFLCGGLTGVEDAGKKALRGELPGQRGQGLPPAAIREYSATISRPMIRQARVSPKGILNERTGRIDCDALSRAAKAMDP